MPSGSKLDQWWADNLDAIAESLTSTGWERARNCTNGMIETLLDRKGDRPPLHATQAQCVQLLLAKGRVAIVSGGRDYEPTGVAARRFLAWLDRYQPVELWHGAARGCDSWAGEQAWARGIVPVSFPADWDQHGDAAGRLRNAELGEAARKRVNLGATVRWWFFDGGTGTADARQVAKRLGISIEPAWQAALMF